MKYRHRPTEVEAWQFDRDVERDDYPSFLAPARIGAFYAQPGDGKPLHLAVHTLEGVMRAEPGDWIVRGTAGEVYPVARDLFEKLYEPVQ